MAVISMPREMGSGGRDVAIGLAERLGLQILHYEVVRRVADRAQLHESAVQRFLEGRDSPLERWRLKRRKLDYYSAGEIVDIAQSGNVIIRGWGGTQVLRPVSHVVSVRVCAPIEHRVRTLCERIGLDDPVQARAEIERNDAAQEKVTRRLFGVDWRDPLYYDLVLNTERVSIPECVDQVARLAGLPAFRETPESRAALAAQRNRRQRAASSAAQWVEWRGVSAARNTTFDRPVMREDRDLI
jgi:cytidylate kinase